MNLGDCSFMSRKAISISLSIAIMGAFGFQCPCFAAGFMSEHFSSAGYNPSKLLDAGAKACEPSSFDRVLMQLANDSRAISGAQKRPALVYDAIGFAEYFGRKRDLKRLGQELGMPGSQDCSSMVHGDCTNTATLIRELSHLPPGMDWCAAFVADLSKLVDEQSGGGPANVLHPTPASDDASDYASAA